MPLTVKQLADMAGVTPRTLRYYDRIALLRPTAVGENGYRLYDEVAALRLQQILFFRELGFDLARIRAILDHPNYDLHAALLRQRQSLKAEAARIQTLIATLDRTLRYLHGEFSMETRSLFDGFDPAQQERWEEEMRQKYGDTLIAESQRNYRRFSFAERRQIQVEGEAIYRDLAALVGSDPASEPVQAMIRRWHDHTRHFYDPSPEVMLGLAQMYTDHVEMSSFLARLDPGLPAFLRAAVESYAETAGDR